MNNISFPPVNEQMDLISLRVSEIIPDEELERRLADSREKNQPLRVKLGCDPSKPDLHLGHAVVLWKLRQFQECGHHATLIVGDFTGMIGDPSGKNKTRPSLSLEETRANGESYFLQASKILLPEKTTIRYNSEWLGEMKFEEVIRLASRYTIARMLERDDFELRYRGGEPISVHEFLYPLAQAMDSVAIHADIELGGTDQKFNLLVGREIQREYGQEPQIIITMPILEGTDGVEKMSKSLGNYVGITESPQEMYGKILSIPDTLLRRYFMLAANAPSQRISQLDRELAQSDFNPRDAKRELARAIVSLYHDMNAARDAEEMFDRIFVHKEIPEDLEEFSVPRAHRFTITEILLHTGMASSRSEARRLINQGGVSLDGVRCPDPYAVFPDKESTTLKVGKRRFLKIIRK